MAQKTRSYITAFYVNKGVEYSPEETSWTSIKERIARELETFGHKVIHRAYEIGRACEVPVEGIISDGIPAQEIMKYVKSHGIIKLIVMGHSSKGRGTQEFVESITKSVVAQSRIPVFVVSREIEIKSILIAVDDSDISRKAVAYGGALAQSTGARIGLLSVMPDAEAAINEYTRIAEVPNIGRHIESSEKDLEEIVQRTLAATRDILKSMDIEAPAIVRKGRPSDEILSEAAHYDLLIIGLRGGQQQKRLGGIANRLLDSHDRNTIFLQ